VIVIINRQFQHDVSSLAGTHQNVSFSVSALPDGSIEAVFAAEKGDVTIERTKRGVKVYQNGKTD